MPGAKCVFLIVFSGELNVMIKKKYLIFILCFLLILSVFALSSCYLSLKKKLDTGRRIVVAGVVVDDEGLPLSGVKMKVVRYKHNPLAVLLGGGSDSTDQETMSDDTVDESFAVDVNDASFVELKFSSVGYFLEKFAVPSDAQMDRDGHISDMRIVLQKKPAVVPLCLVAHRVSYFADGSGVLLDMTKLAEYPEIHESRNLQTWDYFVPFEKYDDAVSNQPHGLALYSDNVKDGEIVLAELEKPLPADRLAPENMQLKMLNDADGIQLYEKRPWMRSSTHVIRGMSMAPVDGYVKTIEIRPEDLVDDMYIYFRIDGRYGKMQLSGIQMKKDRKSISFWGKVFVQPVPGERALGEERQY